MIHTYKLVQAWNLYNIYTIFIQYLYNIYTIYIKYKFLINTNYPNFVSLKYIHWNYEVLNA